MSSSNLHFRNDGQMITFSRSSSKGDNKLTTKHKRCTNNESPISAEATPKYGSSPNDDDSMPKCSLQCENRCAREEAAALNSNLRKTTRRVVGIATPSTNNIHSIDEISTLEAQSSKANYFSYCSIHVARPPPLHRRRHKNEEKEMESFHTKEQNGMLKRPFSDTIGQLQPVQSKQASGSSTCTDVNQTDKHRVDHHSMTLGQNGSEILTVPVPANCNLTRNQTSDVQGRGGLEATTTKQKYTTAMEQGAVVTKSRFRVYQEKNWSDKLEKLLEFRQGHGHCNVPTSHGDKSLARWVKRQRYQYSLLLDHRSDTTLTPDRVQSLEKMGFVWDPQSEKWAQRFNELKLFKQLFGHINVPALYTNNPSLGVWIQSQRRQYVLLQQEGKPTFLSPDRIQLLESIGIEWKIRKRNTYTIQSQKP